VQEAEATVAPIATPVAQPVQRTPGELVHAGEFLALTQAFDEELAFEHVVALSSPQFAGRQAGSPGGHAAAEYIAERFAAYGLQPAGNDGSYFQEFTVPYGELLTTPKLAVIASDGIITDSYRFRTDFTILTGGYLGTGSMEADVVWLNYCGHDDYQGLDMEGKIAFCRPGGEDVFRQAIEHQVGGLLLLTEDEGRLSMGRSYRQTSWVPEPIPAFRISPAVAQDLLAGSGLTLDDLTIQYTPLTLTTRARLEVSLVEEDAAVARNVLGVLPGSDPEARDEVVIVGAHYDHLGRDPDGTIFAGANDDASGVAVLLEIARLWQEQGYVPERTVLFAAWDAEEKGLLGSQYYVEHPRYPLTATIGMIQMDMVGAGDSPSIFIDGEGPVAEQLEVSARTLGITTTLQNIGRSDHASFWREGVLASLLIWWSPDETTVPAYHTPDDTAETIEPEKLKASGALAGHALLALSTQHDEIEEAIAHLEEAIVAGDREVYLAGVDADLLAQQAAWFDDLHSQPLEEFELTSESIVAAGQVATATLRLRYQLEGAESAESVSYPARFVARDGRWLYSGLALESLATDHFAIAYFPQVKVSASRLITPTETTYLRLAEEMGFAPQGVTEIVLFPNAELMRALAQPSTEELSAWVPSGQIAWIARGEPITPTLVSLALNQLGLPPGAGSWLREGLSLHFGGRTRDYLPQLVTTALPLRGFPAFEGVAEEEALARRGQAWSMTAYLVERYGWDGLRRLCAAWGRTGDMNAAFHEALGVSPAQFEAAWRAEALQPLRQADEAIQAVLAERERAVLAGDLDAFLATVDPANITLYQEEQRWFEDLNAHPVEDFQLAGALVALENDEALVDLRLSYKLRAGDTGAVRYDALFVAREGRWFYAGLPWEERVSEHFVVKYQGRDNDWAQGILEVAEAAYQQVTTDLQAAPDGPVELKLYRDRSVFRASVMLSLPQWVSGWTEPGEAIKLVVRPDGDYSRVIAHELTHQVLFQLGLETDWLHEGIATYEEGRMSPLGFQWATAEYLPQVEKALRRHELFALEEMPPFQEIEEERAKVAYGQVWTMVSFIVDRFGWEGLNRLVRALAAASVEEGFQRALHLDLAEFEAQWSEYVRAGQIPEELLNLAQGFDEGHALDYVRALSGPEYAGRLAGTPEDLAIAEYIAGEFAKFGLEPAGDDGTYFQSFPISYTRPITVPTLAIVDADGAVVHQFGYLQDFREVVGAWAGSGLAEAQVVWVRDPEYTDMRLGGRIVLRQGVKDVEAEAKRALEHGASGLIVASGKKAEALLTHQGYKPSVVTATIPVCEITQDAFATMLELGGHTLTELNTAPPALRLNLRARMEVAVARVTSHTQNVLGVIPGEGEGVLIVGAHYDHVGALPDGTYYPGANNDASGVAVLMEIARLWQEVGWRPRRTVLFAAWGANELGLAGSRHYLENPTHPLTDTLAVFQLDSVGAGIGFYLDAHGGEEASPLLFWLSNVADQLDRRVSDKGYRGGSDHEPFHANGLPAVLLAWAEAQELHRPTDTIDRIDPRKLDTTGEVVALALMMLSP
jgi:Zn-dependent M28 family amino/carboxypeptidase